MSAAGQTEKNSVWANIFRVTPDSGHYSIQSACLKRARDGLMRCNKFGHQNSLSVVQLVEQGLSLFQVARVEAFAEPAVDRREKLAGLLPFALIAPQPG
jgi:hypothetical protein